MKHTPGPWVNEQAGSTARIFADYGLEKRRMVAHMPMRYILNETEHQANADLIAAAPELLDALTEMLAAYDVPRDCCVKARRIINKATGGQP